MGEYADDAIERGFEDFEHFEKYRDADHATQYEEGLIDEVGNFYGDPTFNSGGLF